MTNGKWIDWKKLKPPREGSYWTKRGENDEPFITKIDRDEFGKLIAWKDSDINYRFDRVYWIGFWYGPHPIEKPRSSFENVFTRVDL